MKKNVLLTALLIALSFNACDRSQEENIDIEHNTVQPDQNNPISRDEPVVPPLIRDTNTTTPDISDTTAPIFATPSQISVNENQIFVTTLVANDETSDVSFSLSGDDALVFNLSNTTHRLTFKSAPDFENIKSYALVITATDASNNSNYLDLNITILDLDETVEDRIAPILTIPKALSVYEGETAVLTVTSRDAQSQVFYSIALGQSAAYFNIDRITGEITFKEAPNFDDKTAYGFYVIARDEAGNFTKKLIVVNVLDLLANSTDITPPLFDLDTDIDVNENQFDVITLSASDAQSAVTYTLKGEDVNGFNIENDTGKVTFRRTPNFELKNKFNIIAIASDASGNKVEHDLIVHIQDLNEEIDDRNFINTIDLETLAQNQGLSVSQYVISQMTPTLPTTFVTEDKKIFTYDKDSEYTQRYIQDNWAANFDYTGVSWNAIQAGTLITSQHMVLASHFSRSLGSKVFFYTKEGTIVRRTIVASRTLGTTRDGSTYDDRIFDATIIKLDFPVPHSIKVYSILEGLNANNQKYTNELDNVPYVYTDQRKTNHLEAIKGLYDYTYNGHTNDSFIVDGWTYNNYSFMHHNPVGGDSGHPSFLYLEGELVLLSTLSTSGSQRMSGPFYGDNEFTEYLNFAIKEMEFE